MKINNLSKYYNDLNVISNLFLEIKQQEIVSILGPSGSGKTTLLNLITQLEKQDYGEINFSEDEKKIGYMMQDTVLLPWRTLQENALLGIEITEKKSLHNQQLVDYYFELFDLAQFKHIYPDAASGGMKQRVALIRTLMINPNLLLLDEPFASLDFDIKLRIQRKLVEYHHQNNTSIILVTHDIEDAIALSNRVLILSGKPSHIKAEISINLDVTKQDPIKARKSRQFRDYFVEIWHELQYSDKTA